MCPKWSQTRTKLFEYFNDTTPEAKILAEQLEEFYNYKNVFVYER